MKAYRINPNSVNEPWYYDSIFHGETLAKAKVEAAREYDMEYVDVRLVRSPENDLVEFEGKQITLLKKEYILQRRICDEKLRSLKILNTKIDELTKKKL